ncbi:FUSC family protein [Pseudodonghicola flavimaris]|uniref:FUSC family protein n=1 Tax=Pseudodonghicola flavimaris TaxID=3050036 RepID=A0ABT7F0A5_9RHOB|nr:FUSC family protein [Pseudodonghicola flavimaris]MDK3018019.1 FUSC family protein [Pseudodonghicola flavimaris]
MRGRDSTRNRPGAGSAEGSPRRADSLRQLLHRRQLLDAVTLARQPSLRNAALAGLQAALAMVIALPLFHFSPWPQLTGFASLGAMVALFGRFAPERGRSRILLMAALSQSFAVFAMSLAVWLGAPTALQLGLLALACGGFFFLTVSAGFGPPGALIFVFAAGAAMGHVDSFTVVLGRTLATAGVAALACAICWGMETLRQPAAAAQRAPDDAARPLGHRLFASGRIVIGAGLAAAISHALGGHYPAWAAMGALAVMQGGHLHVSMNRALQRMAGTVVGALIAWAILIQDPGFLTVAVALAILQFTTELIIGTNYAFGQVLVTPMALLMSHLAAPATAGPAMAPERVIDTLLGASLGILVAVIFSSLDDRRHLAEHHRARLDG